ncbi:DOMON domain-containing protein [candidate division WOR-3 bacterium]|nr:DOMON domain-containing protein [candidate division WOR-3 bacterium]
MIKRSVALLLGMGLFLGCASKTKGQEEIEQSPEPTSQDITVEEDSVEESLEVLYNKLAAGDFTMEWMTDNEYLHVKLSAPTTGWVALGIAPSSMMKDADFIMGYVKGGEVYVSDEYGNSATSHTPDTDLGGKDNILDKAGSEADGVTRISFKIPLNSGDSYDKILEPGGTYKVIFAYGSSDDFTSYHKKKTSAEIEAL